MISDKQNLKVSAAPKPQYKAQYKKKRSVFLCARVQCSLLSQSELESAAQTSER